MAFADVSNSGSLTQIQFSVAAPRYTLLSCRQLCTQAFLANHPTLAHSESACRWRNCRRGLSVEGICKNPSCSAFQKMVIDPRGMTSWRLIEGEAAWPLCCTQFQPVTCAFTGCIWMYDGRKAGDSVGISSAWQVSRQAFMCGMHA